MGLGNEAWGYVNGFAKLSTRLVWATSPIHLVVESARTRKDVAVIDMDSGDRGTLRRINDFGAKWASILTSPGTTIVAPPDLEAMTKRVVKAAKGHPLRSLMITGHGSAGVQYLGETPIASGTWIDPRLSALKPVIDKDTVIRLEGCHVGAGAAGETLVRTMVRTFGAEVRAAETMQLSNGSGINGSVLACRPNASEPDGVSCRRAADELMLWF